LPPEPFGFARQIRDRGEESGCLTFGLRRGERRDGDRPFQHMPVECVAVSSTKMASSMS